jgi:hypothetical protein
MALTHHDDKLKEPFAKLNLSFSPGFRLGLSASSERLEPFQRFSKRICNIEAILEIVKTVQKSGPHSDPRLKPGENEKLREVEFCKSL